MHSTRTNIVIGMPEESVYRDSESGKLEESNLFKSMLSPHQTRFDCDSQGRLSVAVHSLSTTTLEQSVGFAMPALSHSTAVATPFGSVIGINNVESNILVEASAFKVGSELVEGDAQDFLVYFSSDWFESFEVFNADVSIILQSQVGDVSDDFSNSVFDEVLFSSLEKSKFSDCFMTSLVCVALEDTPSTKNLFAFNPDVFSIVELFEDSSFWTQDADCEALAVHINANHVPAGSCDSFLTQEGNYLSVCGESICLANPTILNQGSVSLEVPIPTDWNSNRLSGVSGKLDEEIVFGFKGLAISRHVKLDCDTFERSSFGVDYAPFNIADYLTSEGGGFFGS